MPDKIKVSVISVIIVTWNSLDEIISCIYSIINNQNKSDSEIELIVVDNNSSDDTKEKLEQIKKEFHDKIILIYNKENLGFTKACNQGIEISTGDNILLLNPDTEIVNNAIGKMADKLNSEVSIGAVAPKLLNEDGSIQKSCRTFPEYSDMFFEMTLLSKLFPKSKMFSRWKMNYFDYDTECKVEQPMAAALMIKKGVLENIDNFDERYKMFFNDVDICKKIYDSGKSIIFYPDAEVIHIKGVSIYKDRVKMIRTWNKDCAEYFKKYHNNIILFNLLKAGLAISGAVRILLYKLTK
ncbi:MAG: glycosyltransferase family 2 protein [Ignavibacteria bacterium]